ncbi:MAG: hypothetical protein EA369_09810 [Bradymonadales bacterium]|nr:MAG: hypothetical protein EA369_09810 [Bradymonadales bacterium]
MVIAQSQQREKLSTMGELATVLAHEIKNPMNSIIIHLEVLKSCVQELRGHEPTRQKAKRKLEVIEGEIRRLEKVISGFLDLATPCSSETTPLQINSLVEELTELLGPEFKKKKIQLRRELQADLPDITGRSDQLKQAILNLMINASQALPKGGVIEVSTGSDEKLLWVQVKDDGSGIPANIKDQIFSPYFTTKEKGSGLGLAIVRRIIREHGGYIEVSSEEGQGATFRVTLPRTEVVLASGHGEIR